MQSQPKQGYLYVKSGIFGTWKKKYWALEPPFLVEYRKPVVQFLQKFNSIQAHI